MRSPPTSSSCAREASSGRTVEQGPAGHSTGRTVAGVSPMHVGPMLRSPVRVLHRAVEERMPATVNIQGGSSSPALLSPADVVSTPSPRAPVVEAVVASTTPLRRSGRHPMAVDGATSTDEDSLARAMRLQATHNLDFSQGVAIMENMEMEITIANASRGVRIDEGL